MKGAAAWIGGSCLLGAIAGISMWAPDDHRGNPNKNLIHTDAVNEQNLRDSSSMLTAEQAILSQPKVAPARPFQFTGSAVDRARAAECLAAAAWYEAGDDRIGQSAVIQTVVNRVNHAAFPNSFCGTVFEGSHLATGCQFTFTCDGSLKKRSPSQAARQRALALSIKALSGTVDPSIGNATHYHADYVSPWWSPKLEKVASIGNHIFYRWHHSRGIAASRTRLDPEAKFSDLIGSARSVPSGHELAQIGSANINSLSAPAPTAELAQPLAPKRRDGTIVTAVDLQRASGSWSVSALETCKDKQSCQVIGYTNRQVAERNQAKIAGSRERPLFVFIRDGSSGMNLALWDCDRITRPNQKQCLPSNKAAMDKLMRDRSGG